MTRAHPQLSVCIPTRNRINYLRQLLNSILPQAESLPVEVCVCDNASSDATPNFLAEMQRIYTCLRIKRQDESVGIDANMIASIAMGNGAYIYPMGDDDFLDKAGLGKVLEATYEMGDVYLLNGWHTDRDLNPLSVHFEEDQRGVVFDNLQQAFASLWDKMPFGSFLMSRKIFNAEVFEEYLGTSHAYAGGVWRQLEARHKLGFPIRIQVGSHPVVYLRGGQKSYSDTYVRIMLKDIPLWFQLLAMEASYINVARASLRKHLLDQTKLFTLFRYRSSGQLNVEIVRSSLRVLGWRRYLLALLVACTPVTVVKFVFRLKAGKINA